MTEVSKEIDAKAHKESEVQHIPYIYHPTQVGEFPIKILFDSGNKVNAIKPSFAKKLSLRIDKTNVSSQKIDGSRLETYGIIIVFFQVYNKDGKFCYFEETFLLANITMDLAFEIAFFILSNVKINFNDRELRWKLYTVAKTLSNIRQVQLVGKKQFAVSTPHLEMRSLQFI